LQSLDTYYFRAAYHCRNYRATEPISVNPVNDIALSTGGSPVVLTAEKEPGEPIVDIPVYVFSPACSYLGINGRTDENGQVAFDFADSGYLFRTDYLGYQHWISTCTVPEMLNDLLTITHGDVTVTVNEVYGANSDPIENVRVYLFTTSGAYQGVYADTDTRGQVAFSVPEQDYKVRADYLGTQHWSGDFSGLDPDVDVGIAHGKVNIHVTDSGTDVAGAPVYLFTESGAYLGQVEYTDNGGLAGFIIPEGSYKFRVDHGGIQYWSEVVNVLADEETDITLALDQLALNLPKSFQLVSEL